MPRPQWSARLARPIQVKGGPPLRTLHNARALVLGLPDGIQDRQAWQRAEGGDVEAATKQVELTLFLQARWKLPP